MRIKPFSLALVSLIIGVGLGLLILRLQKSVADQLLELLNSEAHIAGNFHLEWGDSSLTFFPLRGRAHAVSLIDEHGAALTFSKLEADFSLADVLQKRIQLLELRLIGGQARGIGPESTTSRFIKQLLTPAPDKTPEDWDIEVHNVTMLPSQFTESLGKAVLVGEKTTIKVQRLGPNIFNVTASLPEVQAKNIARPFSGSAEIEMQIDSTGFLIKKLDVLLPGLDTRVRGFAPLSSDHQYHTLIKSFVNLGEFAIPVPAEGSLQSELQVGGTRNNATVTGGISNNSPIALGKANPRAFLDTVDITLKGSQSPGVVELAINTLKGTSIAIHAPKPLRISQSGFEGELQFRGLAPQVIGLPMEKIEGTIVISGTLEAPRIRTAASWVTPAIGRCNAEAILEQGVISFTAASEHAGIRSSGKLILANPMRFEDTEISVRYPVLHNATLVGSATVSGSATLNQIGVEGTVGIERGAHQLFDSSITLSRGMFSLRGGDTKKHIEVSIEDLLTDDIPGRAAITTQRFNILGFYTGDDSDCSSLTSRGTFQLDKLSQALPSGSLGIQEFTVGCAPYTLSNVAPSEIVSSPLGITLGKMSLRSNQGDLTLSSALSSSGSLSGKAEGVLDLKNILGLVPYLDDVSGLVRSELTISGTAQKPSIQGTLRLNRGFVSAYDGFFELTNINGAITVQDDTAVLESMYGTLNDGSVLFTGNINVRNFDGSITINANDVTINPSVSSNITFDSALRFDLLPAKLEGTVSLQQGSIHETIELFNIFKDDPKQKKQSLLELKRVLESLPFQSRVIIKGNQSLSIHSNIINTDLSISGLVDTTAAPTELNFALEADTGWILLGDRRFEIRSIQIAAKEGAIEPEVSLQAESLVRTREGEMSLITALVTGPLSDPQLRFASDRGLRQREILTLLTSGTGLLSDARFGTLQQDFSLQPLEFFDDSLLFGLGGWVKRLTRIDSLSFEPAFNPLRGTIDPTIVATKQVVGNISVAARSAFSSSNPDASIELRYPLTERLEVRGITQTFSNERTSAIEGLLVYSALATDAGASTVQIESDSRWLSERIYSTIRQRIPQRITKDDLALVNQKSLEHLREEGFYSAIVSSSCDASSGASVSEDARCDRVIVQVKEGDLSKLSQQSIVSDLPLPQVLAQEIEAVATSLDEASQKQIAQAQQKMLVILRKSGFVQARVTISYDPLMQLLLATISRGKHFTLEFRGNTVFSADDFLESIGFYKGNRPFGTNFVTLLLESMEQLYDTRGFPLATFLPKETLQDDAISLTIEIAEGPKRARTIPKFIGLQTVTETDLLGWMREANPQLLRSFTSAEVDQSRVWNEVLELAQATLQEHGFIEPKVHLSYRNIAPDIVIPVFVVHEGEKVPLLQLVFESLPPGVSPPDTKVAYTNLLAAIDHELIQRSHQAGYISARVATRTTATHAVFTMNPGPRTHIGEMRVVYDGPVTIEQIQATMRIQKGGAWDERDLQEAQRRIFELGLFRKVSIEPTDGAVDSIQEDITVALEPKSPRSLTLGVGANSEFGAHLQAVYLDRGIFLDGRTLSGQVDSYFAYKDGQVTKGVVSFAYNDPHLLSSVYGYVSDIRFQRLNQDTLPFDLDRTTFSNYLHRTWDSGLTATLGHALLFEDLSDVKSGAILEEELDANTNRLSFISSSIGYDARDDALLPTSGWATSLNNQVSAEVLGSEANYYSIDGRFSLLSPVDALSSRLSFASGTRAGIGVPFGANEHVPLSQRFFLGGRNSVRGFKENSLGPKSNEDNSVQGGELILVQNFEARYLLADGIQLNTFFDAGGLFLKGETIRLHDIRESVGIGLRYLAPVGPVGFDFGFPLDERPGESSMRFHFTIGTNF